MNKNSVLGLFFPKMGQLFSAGAVVLAALLVFGFATDANAAKKFNLEKYLAKVTPAQMVPGADRFGKPEGTPPTVGAYKGDELIGYVHLNSDFVSAIGYSGKPIHILIGLDLDGVITGIKMVKHHEPIVLIGIPEKQIVGSNQKNVGTNIVKLIKEKADDDHPVDIISGATVTILVIHDTIVRSSIKVVQRHGLGGIEKGSDTKKAQITREVDMGKDEIRTWEDLLGDGSIRRFKLTNDDINKAFIEAGPKAAADRPEKGKPDDIFIDFYIAPATVPSIGRSLMGDAEYKLMMDRLEPGQQAFLFGAYGPYSFKGSGYVRGGIFDRFHVVQGENSMRFRDRDHKRLGQFEAEGAPHMREMGLFLVPKGSKLEPTLPWRVELLVNRAIGPIEKAFLSYDVEYQLPEKYTKALPVQEKAAEESTAAAEETETKTPALWERIWKDKTKEVVVLMLGLGVLTVIFFFQDYLVKRPRMTYWVRIGFLTYTLVFIGWYANAQLSVVNVFTFFNALIDNFRWEFFLMDPMIFILWGSVAAGLLFWGRGPYCGWLCPFGALQELTNQIAKFFKVPQITVPWWLHERIWPLKYIIFLPLMALSLYSFALAEAFAEVEPFKTAIILKFAREWPYVIYALTLLAAGLFIERFFCRYVCPLGGALGIPGRMRMFDWLKRHKECGSPCHRCAKECMVQAIHPNGKINPNECLYCLHCQVLYCDAFKCPPVITQRLKRERRQALSTSRGKGDKSAA